MPLNEIDDLDNLESSGSEEISLDLSNVYNIKLGGFGNDDNIRTYIASAKVKNLKDDLDLYETLTKDKSWPISQIVQREVDRVRVSNISKSYILSQGRPIKYFPPIIVAILPKDEHGMISLNMNFGESEGLDNSKEMRFARSKYNSNESIKPYVTRADNLSLIKGLFVLEVSKVFETYLFSWDKSKYYAVVIDGKNRLEALYKSAIDDISIENHFQDLIFIDFSKLLKTANQLSPVEVVRRIFVDINTNAQRVGFVRQVLMDDKDLSALCVQTLVDSVKKDGSGKDQDSFIRSQVVDWYGDNLKHTLPHLTGVLSLYQIIDDYLVQESIASINDMRSPRKVSKWVTRLNDVFFVDSTIENAREGNYSDVKPLYTSFSEYEERRSQNLELQAELDD